MSTSLARLTLVSLLPLSFAVAARGQELSTYSSIQFAASGREQAAAVRPYYGDGEDEVDDSLKGDSDEEPKEWKVLDLEDVEPKKRFDLGGPMGGGSPAGVSAFWAPKQNTSGGSDFSLSGQSAKLALPISMSDEGAWMGIANLSRFEIATSEVLPKSGIAVPDELWSIQAGAMHFRDLGGGWTAGGMLMAGSASDRPFDEVRNLTATGMAFLNVPSIDENEWRFGLFYSPTSQLPFPIPSVAYLWRPNPTWDVSIGVPASATYRPTDRTTVNLSWMPLTQVNASVTHDLSDRWRLNAGYLTKTETFWLSERIDEDDRLYLFDQRLFVGIGREIAEGVRLEVSGAYLFDRRLFQGASITGSKDDGFGIESGFMGTVQLSFAR